MHFWNIRWCADVSYTDDGFFVFYDTNFEWEWLIAFFNGFVPVIGSQKDSKHQLRHVWSCRWGFFVVALFLESFGCVFCAFARAVVQRNPPVSFHLFTSSWRWSKLTFTFERHKGFGVKKKRSKVCWFFFWYAVTVEWASTRIRKKQLSRFFLWQLFFIEITLLVTLFWH